jgi:hypothetical protein
MTGTRGTRKARVFSSQLGRSWATPTRERPSGSRVPLARAGGLLAYWWCRSCAGDIRPGNSAGLLSMKVRATSDRRRL